MLAESTAEIFDGSFARSSWFVRRSISVNGVRGLIEAGEAGVNGHANFGDRIDLPLSGKTPTIDRWPIDLFCSGRR